MSIYEMKGDKMEVRKAIVLDMDETLEHGIHEKQ